MPIRSFSRGLPSIHAHYVLNSEEKGYTFSVYKSLLRATFDDACEEELENPIEEPTSTEGTTTTGASQADLDTEDLGTVTLPLSRIVPKDILIKDLDVTLMICTQLQGILTNPDHTTSLYHKAQEMLEVMDNESYVCSMVKEMLEANVDTLDLATKLQEILDQLQASTDLLTKIRNTLEIAQTKLSQFMENVCVGAYKTTLLLRQGHLQGNATLNLRELFLKDFVFRDEYFNQEGGAIAEVGVTTLKWQQRAKNEIQQNSRLEGHAEFLSQDYLQNLGARMPGCRDKSNWKRTSNADWDRALLAIYGDASPDPGAEIDVELDDPVTLNKNVTNISNTLMREYATNIYNYVVTL